MPNNNSTEFKDWVPPSDAIQRLFKFENDVAEVPPQSKQQASLVEFSFSDEEFAKMPSTLMKVVRRTDALLAQNEMVRKAAIDTHNELKGIHTLMIRYARKHLKDADKEAAAAAESSQTANKGFRRPCRISDAMCEFIGKPAGHLSSRVEVNKAINEYIHSNGLTDPDNAQRILPDEKLWSLMSETAKGTQITYFNLQKYIKHHFLKSVK